MPDRSDRIHNIALAIFGVILFRLWWVQDFNHRPSAPNQLPILRAKFDFNGREYHVETPWDPQWYRPGMTEDEKNREHARRHRSKIEATVVELGRG